MSTKAGTRARPHLLKKKDMAESLGISVQAFDKWGVAPVLREGRSAYFSVKDVVDNMLSKVQAIQQPASDDLAPCKHMTG